MESRDNQLKYLRDKLAVYKNYQERRKSLEDDYEQISNDISRLQHYKKLITADKLYCQKFSQDFKKDRYNEISDRAEESLGKVFPNDNFMVYLEPRIHGLNNEVRLLLGKNGRVFPMKMQNGRFLRQVTSFSVNTTIQELKDCCPVLMDEALSSGDFESTSTMSLVIKGLIDKGIQMILTEHKPELYNNLPRLQVNLVRDEILDKVTEVKVVDCTEH